MTDPGIQNVPGSRSPKGPIIKTLIEFGGVFRKYPG